MKMKIKIKIKRTIFIVTCLFLFANCTSEVQNKQTDPVLALAPTPPMGWNSWNAFGLNINSQIVMSVADSMVAKGLADAGYEYIVIDDGWQIDRDENGKIIADSTRFPEGIKFLADYVHSRGLKFGIYTCCGTKTCGGRPGSYGYEEIDAQTYAEWGVDFIKEDWCFTDGLDTRIQYKKMSDAIIATGRPMLLSLCEWGVSSPWEWGKGIGSMWRTTNDIQDCFDCIRNWGGAGWVPILEQNVNLAPFAGPGHWNDPDMLEVGNHALNPTECRAHFSMWCMLAAPLIAGNNISTMNDTIRDILTAPEIIAIDQDPLGVQGTRVRNENGLQVWQKPLSDGSVAVALLNVTKSDAQMYVSLEEIGFRKGKKSSVRDLWEQEDLPAITDIFETNVEAHGVVVLKIKGKKAEVSELAFENAEVELNIGNHKLVKVNIMPSVFPVSVSVENEDIVSLKLTGVNTYRIKARKEGETTLTAKTSDGKKSASCRIKVLPSNIPSPWNLDDIRDDKASAEYYDGTFSIEGNGRDIWGGLDQFAFLNQPVESDADISARIVSQTNTDPWAKTGLMFRENNEADSKFIMISVTPVNGVTMQWRETKGEGCSKKDFPAVSLPVYLKLSKSGSMFTAYKSNDGVNWETLGDVKLNQSFPENILVGMAVCSHTSQSLNLSEFDNVKVEPIKYE
ncbi:MAG: alpha-galactosidase [Prolixibacteraceae bacterium]|nr:alpha-galactosidase [Prolixibacteraceae bacterium]